MNHIISYLPPDSHMDSGQYRDQINHLMQHSDDLAMIARYADPHLDQHHLDQHQLDHIMWQRDQLMENSWSPATVRTIHIPQSLGNLAFYILHAPSPYDQSARQIYITLLNAIRRSFSWTIYVYDYMFLVWVIGFVLMIAIMYFK